jgi:hypothetical protein
MDPTVLIVTAKSVQSISGFISSQGLREALSSVVGDVHLNAAKLALETATTAVRPTDRINSVITHLEAAHVAYASVHSQAHNMLRGLDRQQMSNAVEKDVWVCSLLALCYASLGESQAVKMSLLFADKAFENRQLMMQDESGIRFYIKASVNIASLLNTRTWTEGRLQLMSKAQYDKFKAELNSSINRQKLILPTSD